MWVTDNPWPAAVACVALALVLLLGRQGKHGRQFVAASIVLLLLAWGVFIVDSLVVTQRERVEDNVYTMLRAAEREDVPGTVKFFSEQCVPPPAFVEATLRQVTIRNTLRITDVNVRMLAQESRAITHFRANGDISVTGIGDVGFYPSRWELTWQREGEDWRVLKVIRLDPISGEPITLFSSGS